MTNSTYKKILAGTVSAIMCLSAMPSGIGASAADYQDKFKKDGYTFELWNQNGQGNATWTTGDAGLYDCSWSGIQNVLFRAGKRWEDFLDWKSLGTVCVDYDVDYNPSGNSYLCIYGWTKNPNVEYYICDNHHDSWRPPGNNFTKKTEVDLDGGTYEIFQGEHSGPSIFADWDTFGQYWSIRLKNQRRTKGVITVTDHFAAWEANGMKMGQLYEIALNVEGYGSSGRASVKKNDITMGEPVTQAPTEPPTEAKPNDDGSYFMNDFESSTDKWTGRGSAKVASSSDVSYSGSASLAVTGRDKEWNGASISLDPNIFVPGKSYSFSAAAYQKSGAAVDIKMTLQYSGGTGDQYDEIALVSVPSGTWTDVSNVKYTIPAGATDATLYFEAPDSLTDFYIDHFTAAVSGTPSPISGGTVTPPAPTGVTLGDVNGDGVCDAFDVVAARQALIKQMTGSSALKFPNNADVDGSGNFEVNDLVLISKYVLGQIKTFPQAEKPQTTAAPVQPTQPTVTTAAPVDNPGTGGQYANAKEYMAAVKANFTSNVPGDIKSGPAEGKPTKITYHSKKANRDKPANVWLPPNYSESQKYPVLYMNHGVMGNEDNMTSGWGVIEMASALIKKGEVKPFIIVFTQMYTDPNSASPMGITQDGMDRYDDFVYDLSESLMPYMAEHYSVAEGRENTAIAGFSMGGRESIYCGLMLPDKIGYICASSPAPGIFPCQDMYLNHRGSYNLSGQVMGDSSFTFPAGKEPYILMIGGGTADSVVGTFPEQYHQKFEKNGVDHYWFSVPGAGHDASVGTPLFYNFFKNLFKA